ARLADDRAAHAERLDRARRDRRPSGRGNVALAPGAARGPRRERRAPARARGVDEELPAGGAVRRRRAAEGGAARARAEGHAPARLEPARERRAAAEGPAAAGLPPLRGRGSRARQDSRAGDARARPVSARRARAQREAAQLPAVRARRDRIESTDRRVRGGREALHGAVPAGRRASVAGRPGARGALRAPLPGLAGGLPPDRPPRFLLVLRGVRAYRRLDVQPAREVVEGAQGDPVAASDLV